MPLQPDQLESMLVDNVRSYLADYKVSDQIEAERLRELCSTLNYFFGALVQEHEHWNPFHWLDGIAASSVEVRAANEVTLEGYVFVGEHKRGGFAMEPFAASLQISEGVDRLRHYRIMCGDANRAFGTVPYSVSRSPRQTMSPNAWLFTLEN